MGSPGMKPGGPDARTTGHAWYRVFLTARKESNCRGIRHHWTIGDKPVGVPICRWRADPGWKGLKRPLAEGGVEKIGNGQSETGRSRVAADEYLRVGTTIALSVVSQECCSILGQLSCSTQNVESIVKVRQPVCRAFTLSIVGLWNHTSPLFASVYRTQRYPNGLFVVSASPPGRGILSSHHASFIHSSI